MQHHGFLACLSVGALPPYIVALLGVFGIGQHSPSGRRHTWGIFSSSHSAQSSGSTSLGSNPISSPTLLTTPCNAVHAGLSGYASKKLSP